MKQLSFIAAATVLSVASTSAATILSTSFVQDGGLSDLNFTGSFDYALNIGGTDTGTIGDATFTADASTTGVTAVGSTINDWGSTPTLGNATLNAISHNIRHSGNLITLDVVNGQDYTLQGWYYDGGNNARSFDIFIDGDDVTPALSVTSTTAGTSLISVFTIDLTATGSTLSIEAEEDNGGILSGLTLQAVPEPSTLGLVALGGLALLRRRR